MSSGLRFNSNVSYNKLTSLTYDVLPNPVQTLDASHNLLTVFPLDDFSSGIIIVDHNCLDCSQYTSSMCISSEQEECKVNDSSSYDYDSETSNQSYNSESSPFDSSSNNDSQSSPVDGSSNYDSQSSPVDGSSNYDSQRPFDSVISPLSSSPNQDSEGQDSQNETSSSSNPDSSSQSSSTDSRSSESLSSSISSSDSSKKEKKKHSKPSEEEVSASSSIHVDGGSLTWLYITVGIVGALAIVAIIIFAFVLTFVYVYYTFLFCFSPLKTYFNCPKNPAKIRVINPHMAGHIISPK